jgi:hypothetical protein
VQDTQSSRCSSGTRELPGFPGPQEQGSSCLRSGQAVQADRNRRSGEPSGLYRKVGLNLRESPCVSHNEGVLKMRYLITTLVATGLLLFDMNAAAQYRHGGKFPNSDRERQDQLFERVWTDLSTADTLETPLTSDFSRIENAMEDVNLLQHRVNSGDFDSRQFDQAIQAVQEVIDQNITLSGRTLDVLGDDVDRLSALKTRTALGR